MFPTINDPNQKSWHQSATTISNLILAATSFLTLVFLILTKEGNLPNWFPVLIAGLVLLSAAIFLSKPIGRLISRTKKWRLARNQFPRLIRLVEQFADVVSPRRSDTITCVVSNIQRREDWRGIEVQYGAFIQLCDVLMSNLVTRLRTSQHSFQSFEYAISDLSSMVRAFQQLYFVEVMQKLRQKGLGALTEEDKRTIAVSREGFTAFLNSFEGFCKEMNQKVNAQAFQFFYSKPEPL